MTFCLASLNLLKDFWARNPATHSGSLSLFTRAAFSAESDHQKWMGRMHRLAPLQKRLSERHRSRAIPLKQAGIRSLTGALCFAASIRLAFRPTVTSQCSATTGNESFFVNQRPFLTGSPSFLLQENVCTIADEAPASSFGAWHRSKGVDKQVLLDETWWGSETQMFP